ncbi:unnamed protein product [Strongylus vulgaris]|uniref:EGF-like domain-containing protein n=1 Tax=Strongylus vulgaris TaxID=40348 RepID=A0A3P7L6T8_STRVU|nr:unnamed protein product [Strongylus vulgaris]
MSDYECRCHEGYAGDKCDRIRSIGLHHSSAYVALEPWSIEQGNLTFTIRTSNESGLIAYYGDDSFISVELYDGRIKIAFYIGVITCNKEKFRRHHFEGDCRSIDMVKNAECVGYCGEGEKTHRGHDSSQVPMLEYMSSKNVSFASN